MGQKTTIRNRRTKRAAVAMLVARNVEIKKVAKKLRIGVSTARKLRAEAIKDKLLREAHVVDGSALTDTEWRDAQAQAGIANDLGASRIQSAFESSIGKSVTVTIAPSGGPDVHRDGSTPLQRFGKSAAEYVNTILARDPDIRIAATGYGSGLHWLMKGLESLCAVAPRESRPVTWIPLRGEAGLVASPYTSVRLAFEFAAVVNGRQTERYYRAPAAAPPVVPPPRRLMERCESRITIKATRAVLDAYFALLPDYDECFGGDDALVHNADLILTSVGPATVVSRMTEWMWQIGDFDPSVAGCIGDVAGIPLVPRTSQGRHLVDEFETQCLVGARRRDFKAVVSRGGHSIAVAALDVARAPVLIEAAAQGLINEVVVDEVIAKEMERILGTAAQSPTDGRRRLSGRGT